MLRVSAMAVFACLLSLTDGWAADDAHLYKAVAYVTGTEEPERSRGFRNGLIEVFVKLTGEVRLLEDARLQPYLAKAGEMVASFEYEDRMKGIPVHDEQGTRERPHFLRIAFKKTELDSALEELTLSKWPAPRPVLAVMLIVDVPKGSFVLRQNGEDGYGQREALKSISGKRAVPIRLPSLNQQVAVNDIRASNHTKLMEIARSLGADCPLWGALTLDKQGAYWNIDWTLLCRKVNRVWSLSGVSFDEALASGLERSAKLLSDSAGN